MSTEQRVIAASIHAPIQAAQLAETLNQHAADGWQLQEVSTIISRKGGGIYTLSDAYYSDTYYLLLARGDRRHEYRCEVLKRERGTTKDAEAINAKIDELAGDGFALSHLLQATSISPDRDRPTLGTIAHVLIFEMTKEE